MIGAAASRTTAAMREGGTISKTGLRKSGATTATMLSPIHRTGESRLLDEPATTGLKPLETMDFQLFLWGAAAQFERLLSGCETAGLRSVRLDENSSASCVRFQATTALQLPPGRTMDAGPEIRDLLARARDGMPDAVGRIFEAARGHLIDLADRELPLDVRAKIAPSDVVQETAVDVHRDFAQFAGKTPEECFAWLREILRHNVVDAIRRYRDTLKREVAREVSLTSGLGSGDQVLVDGHRLPEGSAIRREEAAELKITMARLPDDYRRVLELRYWGGLSFVAMAPELGRSPDAVRKLWYRAVERLQGELTAAASGSPRQAREHP